MRAATADDRDPRRRRPGRRSPGARHAAATPLRPGPRRVPADRRLQPGRRRRRSGGDDLDRSWVCLASTVARRSPRGRTASPPTPPSTSCASAAAVRRSTSTTKPGTPGTTSPIRWPTGESTGLSIAWPSTRRSTSSPRSSELAVVLRDLCDFDYAEIAATLDVPVGTVKSRIARGRSLLAGRLGNRSPSDERPSATPPNEATDD